MGYILDTFSRPFWTSSVTFSTSTSNPTRLLVHFGLLPASLPRQRPIRRFFSLLLDFLHGFHRVNVQSNTFSHPFWTSSVASTASTSNPPLFLVPFGLQPASQPLQRPVHLSFSSLLDFLSGLLYFNVQSNTFSHPIWTSAMASTASTSSPPLFLIPFGLPP